MHFARQPIGARSLLNKKPIISCVTTGSLVKINFSCEFFFATFIHVC